MSQIYTPPSSPNSFSCDSGLSDSDDEFDLRDRKSAQRAFFSEFTREFSKNHVVDQVSGTIGPAKLSEFLAPILVAKKLGRGNGAVDRALEILEKNSVFGDYTLRDVAKHASSSLVNRSADAEKLAGLVATATGGNLDADVEVLGEQVYRALGRARESISMLKKTKKDFECLRAEALRLGCVAKVAKQISFPRTQEDIIAVIKAHGNGVPVSVDISGAPFLCRCENRVDSVDTLIQITHPDLEDGEQVCGHTFHDECACAFIVRFFAQDLRGADSKPGCNCPECDVPFVLSDLRLLRVRKTKKRPHYSWAERKSDAFKSRRRNLGDAFSDDDEPEPFSVDQ